MSEQEKILDAVKQVLMSDEFLEKLADKILQTRIEIPKFDPFSIPLNPTCDVRKEES